MGLQTHVLGRILSHLLLKVENLRVKVFDLSCIPKFLRHELLEVLLAHVRARPVLDQEDIAAKAEAEEVFFIAVFAISLLEHDHETLKLC